ncbi:MAG: TPM domain-containing protein [Patescibacteria group bacterium]|jgi:uncharacterized protein
MWRRALTIFSLALFLAAGFSARAYYNPGKPVSFVNDYAGVLKTEEVTALNNKLSQFNATTSNEIAVVVIKSLQGDTIENFAVKLFADWGIGKEKKDNGVLLLIAIDDRQMRIETGYGLEGALPDATTFQIISKTLKPAFQNNDYYGGIDQAADDIIAATKGEYSAAAAAPSSIPGFAKNLSFDTIFFIIIAIFYLLSALWRFLAKSKSWWQGGALGGAIGLIIALIFFRTLLVLIILPAVIGVFGLLFDFLVSRVLPQPSPIKQGRNNLWFFGGGGGNGFGGSSGGGFGGFGGGMSGGGGSSGSW